MESSEDLADALEVPRDHWGRAGVLGIDRTDT